MSNKNNSFLSDDFLNTEITVTPEKLGDAIARAAHKQAKEAPKDVQPMLVDFCLHFGAKIMTELLCVDNNLDPVKDMVETMAKHEAEQKTEEETEEDGKQNG